MSKYTKSLCPPAGQPFLETPDGLKYWLVDHMPNLGCQESVLTEDASISMHVYGGDRERGSTYLFCYKGFQIGFFRQGNNKGHYPWWNIKEEYDKETHSSIDTITGIGTPVWDEAATLIRDSKGNEKVDIKARRRGESYVTDITFKDYNEGKRERFQSRAQQDEMLELLPHLFAGLLINLIRLEPGWEHKAKTSVRFSDDLEKAILSGELIDAKRVQFSVKVWLFFSVVVALILVGLYFVLFSYKNSESGDLSDRAPYELNVITRLD